MVSPRTHPQSCTSKTSTFFSHLCVPSVDEGRMKNETNSFTLEPSQTLPLGSWAFSHRLRECTSSTVFHRHPKTHLFVSNMLIWCVSWHPLYLSIFFLYISLIALLCFCCVLLTTGHDLSVDTECSTVSIVIVIVLISSGVVSRGLYPVGTWHNKLEKYLLKGAVIQPSANLKPTLDWTSLKGNSKYSATWVTRWVKRKPLMQHTQFTDLDRRQRLFVPPFRFIVSVDFKISKLP